MNSAVDPGTIRKPVIHHVHELQKRLTWCVLAVLAGAGAAYSVHEWLFWAIQKPLGQTLYYTSPMGGFNFMIKLCLVVGLVIALPIILYQLFSFLGPLLKRHHKLTITAYTLWSFDLAVLGILFAYFVSLPAALHFLSQFGGGNIQSLITVDEYFNFALAYIVGFAAMFQVPLIVLFINRIKPLKPSKMMSTQRFVIVGSFIAAAVLTPTPDPLNQAIMAIPAIILYQIAIVLVWRVNRTRKVKKRRHTPAPVQRTYTKPVVRPIQTPVTITPVQTVVAPVVPQPLPVPNLPPARRMSRRSIDGIVHRSALTPQQQVAPTRHLGDVAIADMA